MKKLFILLAILSPLPAFSMHIMEGFLPAFWSMFWSVVYLPIFIIGFRKIKALLVEKPELKLLLALATAFAFVLSALKLPSVSGSCSHPTGVGLGSLLFGPWVMSVIGVLVLLFQVLLLAHGGITTLGANAFSMAFIGPIFTWLVFFACKKMNVNKKVGVFLAVFVGNMATYICTSAQLAFAHPDVVNGVSTSFYKFVGIFGFTQIPIAIIEGLLTVVVLNLLSDHVPMRFEFLSQYKKRG